MFNNDTKKTKESLEKLENKAKFILNSTKSDTQTYLYRACRYGNAEMVTLLLDYGAIARAHYYTKYSPLFIACHTGNYEIVGILLERYPSLVNIETIESFLPIHAACSQGHLNIVKLIIEYKYSGDFLNIYEASGFNEQKECIVNKYLFPFDLNMVDVNEQTILYTCVLSNKLDICEYLLKIKVKKLNKYELKKLSKKKQLDYKLRNFISSYNQQQVVQTQQIDSAGYSFFNYLKGILDNKPSSSNSNEYLTVRYEAEIKEEDNENEIVEDDDDDELNSRDESLLFSPINLNYYSKFGFTCLHEAINIENLDLIKLLIEHNADVNLPVYDIQNVNSINNNSNSMTTKLQQEPQIVSNCLCEALKKRNKEIFLYLIQLENVRFSQETIKFTIKYCLSTLHGNKIDENYKQMLISVFAYLLSYLKMIPDTEYKVKVITSNNDNINSQVNRRLSKLFYRSIDINSTFNSKVEADGLILAWNSFEPSLNFIYESWLSDISKYYRFGTRNYEVLRVSSKLHTQTVTRIDLSFNTIEVIPLVLFQIESLRVLKLNNNRIKELPIKKTVYDDLSKVEWGADSYKCDLLEDLDLSHNCLTQVIPLIFSLQSLKSLNLSNNELDCLPFDFWNAKSLTELNLSFNRIKLLPLRGPHLSETRGVNQQQPQQHVSLVDKVNDKSSLKTSELLASACPNQVVTRNYIEKPLIKVNFWQIHCLNQNDLIDDVDDVTTLNIDQKKQSIENQFQLYLLELNLSNNQFSQIPPCLSCLMPKLVKLNLSFNLLQTMGSISDYPVSLKFLDLSNNLIGDTVRLINVDMLSYFINEQKTIDFCYLNMMNGSSHNSSNVIKSTNLSVIEKRIARHTHNPQQNQKRRARSHSRSAAASRSILSNAVQNRNPFELFLMNITNDENIRNLALQNEENYLNSHNLQCFLDKLCPHKRHVRLENLKTLNLNHNKIFNLKLTFNLVISNNENLSHLNNDKQKKQQQNSILSQNENELVKQKQLQQSYKYVTSSDDSDSSMSSISKSLKPPVVETSKRKQAIVAASQILPTSPLKKTRPTNDKISKILFPSLTHLDISFNLIKRLPGSLSLLDHLSYLNSSNNSNLTKISPKVGLLSKLWNFDLKNCLNIKDQVLNSMIHKQNSRTSDILGFLKSILEHSKPYTRIKLMFVGIQAIGKTSLLNKLREETTGAQRGRSNSGGSSWNERVANGSNNISTVGIDINEWTFEKPKNSRLPSKNPGSFLQNQQFIDQNNLKSFGPVCFRTWDFAGQREYYATHQYFISKRALYLVCWKLTEQEKGINEIMTWLINIQTRAPGSPVIIIGTHQDQLANLKNYKEISKHLQSLIYSRFVKPNETNENCAFPPIWASIEVSSKTGFNIKQLAYLIYDVASQMKAPGSSKEQNLFEQKIPVTYLLLEDCIYRILKKLRSESRNPILTTDEFLREVKSNIETFNQSTKQQIKKLFDFVMTMKFYWRLSFFTKTAFVFIIMIRH